MNVYLDTSIILRVLFRETNTLSIWGKWDRAFSSSLWRTEAYRTVDRFRLSGNLSDRDVADLTNQIEIVDQTLTIIPVNDKILRRAAEAFPTVIGILDALHLSTALMIRESETIDSFLTHDEQLATAARSLQFRVMGAG